MSQDIRSFFLRSKTNLKKNMAENNLCKQENALVTSEEDEMFTNPLKNKKIVCIKKKKLNDKSHLKKRIISSDEDEIQITSHKKNKKAKIIDDVSSNYVKNLIDRNVKTEELFNKKSVNRVNAVNISKKRNEPIKISMLNHKADFMSKDDDFDATLNQLDTSQIEDDYLLTINNEASSFLKSKEKDFSNKQQNLGEEKATYKCNTKNKEKYRLNLQNKKEKSVKTSSVSKINTFEDDFDTKYENEKKMKGLSNSTLKIGNENKLQSNINKSTDTEYDEIIKKKIQSKKNNAILYKNYLNRGGARNPGSKEIPQGADQCLVNLSFLITGVLDSLEREEAEGIIKHYGGKIIHSVSKKLDYIIIGDEPGPSKLVKAESLGIKKISEDGFLDLIRTSSSGIVNKMCSTNSVYKYKNKRENSSCYGNIESNEKIENVRDLSTNKSTKNIKNMTTSVEYSLNIQETTKANLFIKVESNPIISNIDTSKIVIKRKDSLIKSKISESKKSRIGNKESIPNLSSINELINKTDHDINYGIALVEKYRPKELKQIIGQSGEKSNAKKLQYWLINWYKNHGKDSKILKSKFSSRDDTGAIYKAALLSGPPGIGKTTTAYVVCIQLGYEVLEFNASDTRSKKLLQEEIADILCNKTIKSFLTNNADKKIILPKHVLLMDEVDGMTGNEDRGGMQELIAFIKSTEIPIICICNDRHNQKIKTLANYTFDLRFQKPRLEQIRAAMMSLCFKEGIKVTSEELTLIIQSTNQDIRQVINHVAVLSAKFQTLTENREKIKYKNLQLGPWDVVRKVFSLEENIKMNIHEKSDLFFHDYNIATLFVEENYPIVTPIGCKHQINLKLANCSESLAIGDTIENTIRVDQGWSLLPVQACFSSVIPGSIMTGFLNSQINFPSWFGRNSKRIKCDKLLQEITIHTRITTGASKEAINLDYLKILVDSVIRPMVVEGTTGIEKAINVMNRYHLSREDLDSLIELTKWPHTRDPMQSIDSKTKSTFTKTYNKSGSFSSTNIMKRKYAYDIQSEDFISDKEEVSDENNDDDKIENDKLIKFKISKSKNTLFESKRKIKRTVKINKTCIKK